jgi:hypothetical protein
MESYLEKSLYEEEQQKAAQMSRDTEVILKENMTEQR